MNSILKISALLMISFLMSCESKEQEVEKLKTETIAIHDEVMPKMDDIMKLKKELKSKQDSTSNEEVQRLISALEESDKAMMNWMRNYDPRMEDMSDDEKLEYLKSQKSAIQKVKGKMNSSIAEAEDYLN
jgi:succinate dehydrogenase flavin-adding protein (antitoxin of CptAB toxin-antitoxin module)